MIQRYLTIDYINLIAAAVRYKGQVDKKHGSTKIKAPLLTPQNHKPVKKLSQVVVAHQ